MTNRRKVRNMNRTVYEIAAELFERDALFLTERRELPGDDECHAEMDIACAKDPEGFLNLIQSETSEHIEVVAGFFDVLAELPDGAAWVQRIEEAVKGKETQDILEQIAFAKKCTA